VPALKDSKQLTAQQRDILFDYISAHGRLKHASAFASAETIDSIGIVNATYEAAAAAVAGLGVSAPKAQVLLDAGLKVPREWQQQSFVRGDETIPAIAFASIVAKVTRDRHMEELSYTYGAYGFAQHKGYGTREHLDMLRRMGPGVVHRRSFLGSLM
jgi:ribonuclease HII